MRRTGNRSEARRWPLPALVGAVSEVVGLATLLGISVARQSSAEALRVIIEGDLVEVEVQGPIKDPEAARDQLAEAGVQAHLMDVPTPDELVGQAVMVSSAGNDARIAFADDRVTVFLVPVGGEITVWYGRAAQSGEMFAATTSSPLCALWHNQRVSEIAGDAEAEFESLRWQALAQWEGVEIGGVREVSRPFPDWFIHDVVPIGPTEAIVTIVPERDSLLADRGCSS